MNKPPFSAKLRSSGLVALFVSIPTEVLAGEDPSAQHLPRIEANTPAPGWEAPAEPHQQAGGRLDVTQAHLMLDLLESISEGRHEPELLEAVMSSEGTKLIVGQMNLARQVSMAQYRTLLSGLMAGKKPEIEPVDSTARSRTGVVGLLDNAWPLLNWGLGHTRELEQRINHLQRLDFYERAHAIASHFLPVSFAASPRVYAVIGGRAGAAKIAPDHIYVDVLAYSYRDRGTTGFPSDEELIHSIGHEMHHMGYRSYLDQKMDSLNPNQSEGLLFEFLSGLLSEGSATYLISHGRNLAEMYERRSTRDLLKNHRELILQTEGVLQAILDGEIGTPGEYREATADFLGMWFHSAGSLMLSVIDEASGLKRVMEVVAEPERLLEEYNQAARILGRELDLQLFDDDLAGTLPQLLG